MEKIQFLKNYLSGKLLILKKHIMRIRNPKTTKYTFPQKQQSGIL